MRSHARHEGDQGSRYRQRWGEFAEATLRSPMRSEPIRTPPEAGGASLSLARISRRFRCPRKIPPPEPWPFRPLHHQIRSGDGAGYALRLLAHRGPLVTTTGPPDIRDISRYHSTPPVYDGLVGLRLDRLKHVKLRFIYGSRRTDSSCRPEFNDLGDTYLRLSQSVPCIPVTSGACGILIPSGSGNGDPRGNRTHYLLIKRLMPVVD